MVDIAAPVTLSALCFYWWLDTMPETAQCLITACVLCNNINAVISHIWQLIAFDKCSHFIQDPGRSCDHDLYLKPNNQLNSPTRDCYTRPSGDWEDPLHQYPSVYWGYWHQNGLTLDVLIVCYLLEVTPLWRGIEMYIMTFCKLTDICNTTIVNYHTKQHVLQRYAIILMSKG